MSESSSTSRWSILVWLVPVAALAVSGWLLLRQFRERGPTIEIEFANGSGIVAGKTPLVHKGVVVGLVQDVALTEKLDGVVVRVDLDPSARPLAVADSEFWLVRPEIGLSGVTGLDTLLNGARLGVHAGSGKPETHFRALPKPPPKDGILPGRNFVLRAPTLGSLHPGSSVYYRDVRVGVVESHRLADDATSVLITVRILEPYHLLVRGETQFWNSGGLSMKLGLLGAQVHTNSLESLVSGGVAFATPDQSAGGEVPAEGTLFELHDDADKAWLKWTPKIAIPQDAL